MTNIGGINPTQFIQKLKSAGVTDQEIEAAKSKGPEGFKELMSAHGIQAPDSPSSSTNSTDQEGQEEFMKKLEKAGITKQEFESAMKQGPEAVDKLLESHGITPPNKSQNGSKTDKTSSSVPNDFMKKLQEAGISQESFAAAYKQGPEAVQKLLDAYGVKPE